jgi:predicted ThiF/HesA family dinucleotide-utilizing enzyme
MVRNHGAINIEWLPAAKVLLCRVITRAGGDPAPITGAFINYLLRRFKQEILTIVIRPDA